jgi:AcrR family transcriptional regulator
MKTQRGLRERKNVAVKQALFKAAMELFREKGFDETTVDEIAGRAGFSRVTFFNHFGAKQGVLRYYGQHLYGGMEQLLNGTDSGESPVEQIRQMFFAMVREAEAQKEDLKIIFLYSMRDPKYVLEITPARRKIREMVVAHLEQGQRQAEIRGDLPAGEQADHLFSLYEKIVFDVVTGERQAEPMMRSAWLFVLGGIRGQDPMAG